MTLTIRLRVGAAVLAGCAALLVAAPAYAQTDPPPPGRVTDLKARADQAVKDRLTQIDMLSGRVNGAGADCGQNADVAGQLTSDKSGLQALDATIQAETDGKKAVTEFHQIFTDFRIYWLETPKAREVVVCDRASRAGVTMTALHEKIQTRVDEGKAKGYDVSGAQAALDDMGAKLTDATTHAKGAASSAAGLHPDKGDRSMLSSNFAALSKGRQDLHTAWDDLQAARHDARRAIDELKNLHKG